MRRLHFLDARDVLVRRQLERDRQLEEAGPASTGVEVDEHVRQIVKDRHMRFPRLFGLLLDLLFRGGFLAAAEHAHEVGARPTADQQQQRHDHEENQLLSAEAALAWPRLDFDVFAQIVDRLFGHDLGPSFILKPGSLFRRRRRKSP